LPFFVFPSGRRALLALLLALAAALVRAAPAGAEDNAPALPRIRRLEPGDGVFGQFTADVERSRRRLYDRRREGTEDGAELLDYLVIYAYDSAGEDMYRLAARCNIPYAALATLNRLPHPSGFTGAGTRYLPSMPGLFIPLEPETDLERLLITGRGVDAGIPLTVRRNGRAERFRFIPGGEFSATERIFFLTEGFRFPLKTYRITSAFGPRINPVTGNLRTHQGLDLAAPEGTEVYAARDGVVAETGVDGVYGNYVILQHGDNWASLYGHLSEITADLRRTVRSGTVIGRVGSTGQSTGPHLHFEIRQFGRAQDPGKLLFRDGPP
jgi:hypothetical protein